MKKKMKLVKVRWADACDYPQWENLDTIKQTQPVHCASVGWVVKDTSKCLVLSASLSASGMGVGTMCIPRQNIIAVKRIK